MKRSVGGTSIIIENAPMLYLIPQNLEELKFLELGHSHRALSKIPNAVILEDLIGTSRLKLIAKTEVRQGAGLRDDLS